MAAMHLPRAAGSGCSHRLRRSAGGAKAAAVATAAVVATGMALAAVPRLSLHRLAALAKWGAVPAAMRRHCRVGKPSVVVLRAFSATGSGMDDVSSLPARELRRLLQERNLPYADCFERRELVERLQEALKRERQQEQAGTTAAGSRGRASAPGAAAATASGASTARDASTQGAGFNEFGELVQTGPTALGQEPASLLFLHGLGDSARGFAGQLPMLLQLPEVRFVIPTAPSTPGFGVRSWFDLRGMMSGGMGMAGNPQSAMGGIDNSAMRRSIDYCHHLLRAELAKGVPPGRLLVGGFSQGGCLAVRAALEFPDATLGGCLAVSTFLGSADRLPISAANSRLPVLCCHGEADGVVPTSEGWRLAEVLRQRGLPAVFRSYAGVGHAYSPEEAQDVQRFLRRRLAVHEGEPGLRRLSAREIKALLASLGVDTAGCFDKEDLMERARVSMLAS